MPREAVSFAHPGGGVLAGTLSMPQDRPLGYAIIADRLGAHGIADALELAGVASVHIDLADMEDTAPSTVEAILACARFLAQEYATADLLIGHASGAAAVSLAITSLPDIRGVALLGESAGGDGEPFRGTDPPAGVSFLSLHNVADATVGESTVAAWAGALLARPVEHDPGRLQPGGDVVAHTARSYRTTIGAGRHSLVVDEPVSLGGTDTGPTPYDLVAAALGACTAITLRMYADRKAWPLDAVTVAVHHSRIHAVDDARCDEDDDARLDMLQRRITMEGDLDAEQRAKLLEIADKCPVHRTLDRGIVIRTTLAT